MKTNPDDIFTRLRSGDPVSLDDPAYHNILTVVTRARALVHQLNASADDEEIRCLLGEITQATIPEDTTLFTPLFTNFGIFTSIGKRVFINHACSFLDMGGITIEDDVFIGPRVSLVTENHPLDPHQRRTLVCKPILIRRNAWIGAGATVLPGVTIGKNAVVAAGAVVSKNVPDNVVVAGIPAKIIREVNSTEN